MHSFIDLFLYLTFMYSTVNQILNSTFILFCPNMQIFRGNNFNVIIGQKSLKITNFIFLPWSIFAFDSLFLISITSKNWLSIKHFQWKVGLCSQKMKVKFAGSLCTFCTMSEKSVKLTLFITFTKTNLQEATELLFVTLWRFFRQIYIHANYFDRKKVWKELSNFEKKSSNGQNTARRRQLVSYF